MTPREVLLDVVRPTLDWMGERYRGRRAEAMLLAIQQQEDRLCERRQRGGGPACGLWQIEPGTISRVFRHERAQVTAIGVLVNSGVPNQSMPEEIAARMVDDDRLCCAWARLLLFTDPLHLPQVGEEDAAWDLYLRLWRPGVPRPDDWPASYAAAVGALR